VTNKKLHNFENNPDQWYVEEPWADDAIFKVFPFRAAIYDPCCGGGNIPKAAEKAGFTAIASDIADRGYGEPGIDFFELNAIPHVDIVTNPPYNVLERFIDHALEITDDKARVAVFTRLSFLGSVTRFPAFTARWPTSWVLICSKRVNCLPGANLEAGQKPGGGAIDYCWIIFDKSLPGGHIPRMGFLIPEMD
jgi:hypothetical protein